MRRREREREGQQSHYCQKFQIIYTETKHTILSNSAALFINTWSVHADLELFQFFFIFYCLRLGVAMLHSYCCWLPNGLSSWITYIYICSDFIAWVSFYARDSLKLAISFIPFEWLAWQVIDHNLVQYFCDLEKLITVVVVYMYVLHEIKLCHRKWSEKEIKKRERESEREKLMTWPTTRFMHHHQWRCYALLCELVNDQPNRCLSGYLWHNCYLCIGQP